MRELLIQILWAVGAYIIILKVSINLIGLVVRGFYEKSFSIPDEATPRLAELIKTEIRKERQASIVTTLVSIIGTLAYFYGLYHFWNIGLTATAGIIMACYMPDLLWEIKTGKKVSKNNPSPWPLISNAAILIMLLCLPLTWYCLFRFN